MKHHTFRVTFLTALILLAGAQLSAAQAGDKEIGLKVGETIPSFELPDQSDSTRTFKDLHGSEGLLFIFYRSANW
ncbi:hypothetical protein ACFL30_02225 [Candidatus Latescibacterota bacterium]